MKVRYSNAASADLFEIGDYIAQTDRPRAEAFTNQLAAAAELIADMPLAFPLVPRGESQGLRRKRYKRYLLFYTADAKSIEIIRILHSARDYERVLFPDDEQP